MATKKAATKKAASRKRATKKTPSAKASSAKTSSAKTSSEIPVKTAPAEPAAAKAPAALENLEQLFDDFLRRRWPRPLRWDWPRWNELSSLLDKAAPSVDVVDRAKEVMVRAEVPGIDKEDLDVSITDRTLTIKGSSRQEDKQEGEDYFRQEIRSGAFSRSVVLPADVNAARAKATFKDGLLELHLPKVRASKRQKIALK